MKLCHLGTVATVLPMPTYTYQVITDDDSGAIFEIEQRMSDDALTTHPETGEPVHRIILSPPAIGGSWTETGKDTLSDHNVAKNGFTKYVKTGDGQYERAAGTGGPKTLGH